MARDRERGRKGSAAADRRRVPKKKVSILNSESIKWIDYKDVNLLRRFMSERAKIRARRVTGNSTQQQRAVAKAIRLSREMALLPYSVRQVTQRGGKGRGRGDRERERELPREEIEQPGYSGQLHGDVAVPTEPLAAEGIDAGVDEVTVEASAGDGGEEA